MQPLYRSIKSMLSASLLALALIFVFSSSAAGAEKKKFVVVVDAGHGGHDHGAIENDVNEKDVNLAVALKLGEMISRKLKDTQVVYTRNKDEFISLQKRADIANGAKADLFVSIHCNSVDRSNKNRANVLGATTYVLGRHRDGDNLAVAQRENSVVELDGDDSAHYASFNPDSDESYIIFEMTQKKNLQNSVRFAMDVQKEMVNAGRYSRGVQQAGFWVLWSTAMPAALVELDFICNPEQAKFLNSKDGQEKLAGAIFNAVKKYEQYFRSSMGTASRNVSADEYQASDSKASTAQPSDSKTETVETVELAVSTPAEAQRKHRADTPKKNTTATTTRRRRSASARNNPVMIEETDIVVLEELATNSVDISTAAAAPAQERAEKKESSKKAAKSNSRQNEKSSKKEASKKEEKTVMASAPARRNKDRSTKRRGVKQNVSVGYKVLLFVSDEKLDASDKAFQGLSPISLTRENNQYKYTYGMSEDIADMESLLRELSPLFPEARVIKCYY